MPEFFRSQVTAKLKPEASASSLQPDGSAANVFIVSVLPETGAQRPKRYKVRCHSTDDAIQLAFALDGGWGKDRDASDMLQLAKAYCHVVKQN